MAGTRCAPHQGDERTLPSFTQRSWRIGDVSQQLATLPVGRCCSGKVYMEAMMVFPERDLPSAAGAAQHEMTDKLTCLEQVRHRITPEALAATVAFFNAIFKRESPEHPDPRC